MQPIQTVSEVVPGIAIGAAASSVSIAFGAPWDALVAGLLAAVFISIWLETIDNKVKAASAILFSGLLAAYGSPVVAGWAAGNLIDTADPDALRVFVALLLGAVSPSIVPLLLKIARKKTEDRL